MKKTPKAVKHGRGRKVLKYTGRVGIILLTLILFVAAGLYSLMFVLAKGPSPTARNLFVRSVMETSAAKFLARLYFSEDEIAAILAADGDEEEDDRRINPDLIQIPGAQTGEDSSHVTLPFGGDRKPTSDPLPTEPAHSTDPGSDPTVPDVSKDSDDGIEIVDVKGSTYYGKMIIIKDPARVAVGTLPVYGEEYKGKTLRKFIKDEGAIGGINAGGFWDDGGQGSGSIPDGIVIRNGEIVWGSPTEKYKCVVGFDKNHILHVGNMTGAQALEEGIVDGLSFARGPLLVVNGVPETARRSLGGGLNPRTAIGQRADGAILMLVINGRQADALGATHDDTCNVMASFGAVNAANLDGGSSSLMIYNGETLNQSAYLLGERRLPNVFLIMPEK